MNRIKGIVAITGVCVFALLHADMSYAQAEANAPAHEHGQHMNDEDGTKADHADDHGHDTSSSHAPDAAAKDHAMDHGDRAGVPGVVQLLGKFHPIAVHFPIALLLAAALSEAISVSKRQNKISDVTYFCVLLGALGAVAAAPLGWANAWGVQFTDELAGVSVVLIHRVLGTVGALAALLTLGLAAKARRSTDPTPITPFRLTLFFTAALIGVTGHFGASLVFGLDYFNP